MVTLVSLLEKDDVSVLQNQARKRTDKAKVQRGRGGALCRV